MIIVDLSQVMNASLAAQAVAERGKAIQIDTGLLRHMVLNTILSIKRKFSPTYGEITLATDARSWRKEFFPYYKFARSEKREASLLDWKAVFESMNLIRSEIKEHMPYRVVGTAGAEADDIIGVLCREFAGGPLEGKEEILIVSGDHDFKQLHAIDGVSQYDWVNKKKVVCGDPVAYLIEHALKGDRGDGVPNVLSDDDVFVVKKRQVPLTQKRYDELFEKAKRGQLDSDRNYVRNTTLVDLSKTPQEVYERILETYHSEAGKGREKVFNYFLQAKLKNLMAHCGEF